MDDFGVELIGTQSDNIALAKLLLYQAGENNLDEVEIISMQVTAHGIRIIVRLEQIEKTLFLKTHKVRPYQVRHDVSQEHTD